MADIRPLHWNGTELTKFTDAQLETLSYYIRKNYALALRDDPDGTYGSVKVSSTPSDYWTEIGEMYDEYFRIIEYGYHGGAYTYAPYLDNYAPDLKGYVTSAGSLANEGLNQISTLSKEISIRYYYTQLRASLPTDTTTTLPPLRWGDSMYTKYGMIGWNSSSKQTQVIGTDEDLFNSIIEHSLNELRYGDMVGSYRIETQTPNVTRGGAGTWELMSTAFVDHITTVDQNFIDSYLRNNTYIFNTFTKAQGNEYDYPTESETKHDMTDVALSIHNTYNLYLKTSLDNEPDISTISPVRHNSLNSMRIHEDKTRYSDFMHLFVNSMQRYAPIYAIQSRGAGINTRGSISNTRRKTYKEEAPTLLANKKTPSFFEYSKIAYSTGDLINRATKYFVIKGLSSPEVY